MSLRTTCSYCHSVFRITEQQLAAADGWAQCGVCAASFDALANMPNDERARYLTPPAPAPGATAALSLAEGPASTAEQQPPAPSSLPPELAPDTTAAAEPAEQVAPARSNLPGLERRFAADAAEARGAAHADLPSIIIVDPDARVPEDIGPMPDIQEPSAQPYGYPVHELEDDDDEEEDGVHGGAAEPTVAAVSRPMPGEASIALADEGEKKVSGWLWIVMPLLILLLFGQLAYFLRNPLAARYPSVRPLFSSACDILGCRMGLPQNVDQIKILGSDLQADSGNNKRLTLVLTLANQASYPQAWPMLQLSLTDTRDNVLARRVFAPSEYLNRPGILEAGIPALSEIPLSLHLETTDLNASGFRVEVFY